VVKVKAAFLVGPSKMEIRDVKIPEAGEGEVLVKMKAMSICGTDIGRFHGHHKEKYVGHEVSGVVEEMGENVTVHGNPPDFKVGDRVFVHHHVPCYTCYYCRHGSQTMCDEFPRTYLEPGVLAEYFKVSRFKVERGSILKIPDEISFEEACLIEPLATCIKGMNRVKSAGVCRLETQLRLWAPDP